MASSREICARVGLAVAVTLLKVPPLGCLASARQVLARRRESISSRVGGDTEPARRVRAFARSAPLFLLPYSTVRPRSRRAENPLIAKLAWLQLAYWGIRTMEGVHPCANGSLLQSRPRQSLASLDTGCFPADRTKPTNARHAP